MLKVFTNYRKLVRIAPQLSFNDRPARLSRLLVGDVLGVTTRQPGDHAMGVEEVISMKRAIERLNDTVQQNRRDAFSSIQASLHNAMLSHAKALLSQQEFPHVASEVRTAEMIAEGVWNKLRRACDDGPVQIFGESHLLAHLMLLADRVVAENNGVFPDR